MSAAKKIIDSFLGAFKRLPDGWDGREHPSPTRSAGPEPPSPRSDNVASVCVSTSSPLRTKQDSISKTPILSNKSNKLTAEKAECASEKAKDIDKGKGSQIQIRFSFAGGSKEKEEPRARSIRKIKEPEVEELTLSQYQLKATSPCQVSTPQKLEIAPRRSFQSQFRTKNLTIGAQTVKQNVLPEQRKVQNPPRLSLLPVQNKSPYRGIRKTPNESSYWKKMKLTCAFCLENINGEESVLLRCVHKAHSRCLQRKRISYCEMCKVGKL